MWDTFKSVDIFVDDRAKITVRHFDKWFKTLVIPTKDDKRMELLTFWFEKIFISHNYISGVDKAYKFRS